jgi:flagellar protein FliS
MFSDKPQNPYEHYKRTNIETAGQKNLILMAYDGIIKNLNEAKENIEERDIMAATLNLTKAQEIISVLFHSLDFSVGEVAYELGSFYEFVRKRLIMANRHKDERIIDEVLRLVVRIRDAWAESFRKSVRMRSQGEARETKIDFSR